MTARAHSISELHKRWAKLENEHHELAGRIKGAQLGGADLALLRDKQAKLLLDINAVVAEIRGAPASTVEDYLALLDVAIEHEIDLVADIAFYGREDYPMIARLLRSDGWHLSRPRLSRVRPVLDARQRNGPRILRGTHRSRSLS